MTITQINRTAQLNLLGERFIQSYILQLSHFSDPFQSLFSILSVLGSANPSQSCHSYRKLKTSHPFVAITISAVMIDIKIHYLDIPKFKIKTLT